MLGSSPIVKPDRAGRAVPVLVIVLTLGVFAATLAMIEETPYGEIAAALGISAAAVKSRVFRATRLLRTSLRRAGVEP